MAYFKFEYPQTIDIMATTMDKLHTVIKTTVDESMSRVYDRFDAGQQEIMIIAAQLTSQMKMLATIMNEFTNRLDVLEKKVYGIQSKLGLGDQAIQYAGPIDLIPTRESHEEPVRDVMTSDDE